MVGNGWWGRGGRGHPTAAEVTAVDIDLAAGAGCIDGVHASGPIRATTAAGSIELTVTQDVDRLSAATGAGSIDLNVPDATYDVTASTGVGHTHLDAASVPGPRRVRRAGPGLAQPHRRVRGQPP